MDLAGKGASSVDTFCIWIALSVGFALGMFVAALQTSRDKDRQKRVLL